MRVGVGVDAHPFGEERGLRLGGLDWPEHRRLSGHSDGDVLLHAICDALLGAAGLGSLGERFSDRDPAERGRDSGGMLEAVAAAVAGAGFRVGNVDAVLVGESPRLAGRRAEIERAVAARVGTDASRISVRGTSTNGLGFPGRGEGLSAVAVVLLEEA